MDLFTLKTFVDSTPSTSSTFLYLSKYKHKSHRDVPAGDPFSTSTANAEPATTLQKFLIETGPASIGPKMAVVSCGSAETKTIHDLFPHVERYAQNLICETETIHELVPHVERYAANLICFHILQRGLFLYFDTV